MCNEPIEVGRFCQLCEAKLMEKQVFGQIGLNTKRLYIVITHCKAKETADLILKAYDENDNIEVIEIIARGNLISKAVDVVEMIKREYGIIPKIDTATITKKDAQGEICKISELKILFAGTK